jgi:hypothetical protein
MSDARWFLKQGFEIVDELSSGFVILALNLKQQAKRPRFNDSAKKQILQNVEGCVVYYSNRCPYAEYHVKNSLVESCQKRNIPLEIIKLIDVKQAQAAPTPATIFSLFYKGRFVTTDIGSCMDSRFDKLNLGQ